MDYEDLIKTAEEILKSAKLFLEDKEYKHLHHDVKTHVYGVKTYRNSLVNIKRIQDCEIKNIDLEFNGGKKNNKVYTEESSIYIDSEYETHLTDSIIELIVEHYTNLLLLEIMLLDEILTDKEI